MIQLPPEDQIITYFCLDDFPQLTTDEILALRSDFGSRTQLAKHFLNGLPFWDEAAATAVEIWRDDRLAQSA